MGKPTGFLDYDRKTAPGEAPKARIAHFNEFHPPLDVATRQQQGGRCMECGVPFCQSGVVLGGGVSGCPLHNLIPEWNDCVYHGDMPRGLARLLKTNPFPEFTGRVCPALCEAACTCGLNGEPVTVKENELWLIEEGWAEGRLSDAPPAVRSGKTVAVVGSGPAGLAVADRLNHRGHSVTVFEKANRIGGLLMYGIPNMKLEKHVIDRRVALMTAQGITFRTSTEVGVDVTKESLLADFDAVILCCGAEQPRDLTAEGRDADGIYFAVDFLTSTTKSLLDTKLAEGTFVSAKGKKVVVVGGGDTGNDCVGTCVRHGCDSVIQLEMMPKAPDCRAENNPWPQWPKICKTDYGQEEAAAVFGSDPRRYQTTVTRFVSDKDNHLTAVEIVGLDDKLKPIAGTEETLDCDLLLIAAGFVGCRATMAEHFGLDRTNRGVIATTEGHKTVVDKVFVAGDMSRGQSLVVWAIAEGRACAKEVDQYLMGYTNLD